MRIRREQLAEGSLKLKFEERPETFPVLAEMVAEGICELPAPLVVALRAQQIGDMVEIEGSISTTARLNCSRCLQPFGTPIESSFTLTYSQKEPALEQGSPNQEELELTAEEMGLIHYRGEEINLKDEIQEQVVLAFPIRALCKSGCRGLCPTCGEDLNTAACECAPSPSGGKFEALKKLALGKD